MIKNIINKEITEDNIKYYINFLEKNNLINEYSFIYNQLQELLKLIELKKHYISIQNYTLAAETRDSERNLIKNVKKHLLREIIIESIIKS